MSRFALLLVFCVITTLLCCTSIAAASQSMAADDDNIVDNEPFTFDKVRDLFGKFMGKFNKQYRSSDELNKKFATFAANMERIRELNMQEVTKFVAQNKQELIGDFFGLLTGVDPQTQIKEIIRKYAAKVPFGVTQFSDMTPEEFQRRMLLPPSEAHPRDALDGIVTEMSDEEVMSLQSTTLPSAFSWIDRNGVTSVKNQGQCGSCWTFATAATIESQYLIRHGKTLDLAEQQLVDCDKTPNAAGRANNGCNGGGVERALTYVRDHGMVAESAYPYVAKEQQCRFNPQTMTPVARVTGYQWLPRLDEAAMAAYLVKNGPFTVYVDANQLQHYRGGIMDPADCKRDGTINHAVVVVGYGSSPSPHWIIKNSWGPNWAEKGFYRLAKGKNQCSVASYPIAAQM